MNELQILLNDEQLKRIGEQVAASLDIKEIIELVSSGERYMNKKQTCKYLKVSNNTLDSWILCGLPQILINNSVRYDRFAIDRWMNQLEKTS
ncbi:DNA-binding protein [Enterococcus faecalis]